MRLQRRVRTLAAVASLAVVAPSAAQASSSIGEGGGSLPPTAPAVSPASAHTDSGSPDWALIALGTGGAVAIVGVGVGESRRRNRREAAASGVRARVS